MSRTSISILLGLLTLAACAPLDDDFNTGGELTEYDALEYEALEAANLGEALELRQLPVLPSAEVEEEGEVMIPCIENTLDFDTRPGGRPILAGEDLTNVFSSLGITIRATDYAGAVAGNAIVFDTSAPTGEDHDLGTPNEAFGGPGIGAGGADTNDIALGNVMIRAEDMVDADGDGLVDDPDDHGRGARLVLEFRRDACIDSADLLDVEDRERPAEFVMFDADGVEIASYEGGGLGNNSVEGLEMGDCGVRELVIFLRGSGAIDNINVCVPAIPNTEL